MAITAAERHEIAELLVLMFNAAPGATYLSQIVSVYQSVGTGNYKGLAEVLGQVPGYGQTHPNYWTGDDFATNLLTPLGLAGDFQARTRIVNAFNTATAVIPQGQTADYVIHKAMADITYGAYAFLNDVSANPSGFAVQYQNAAKIMNNKADVSIYYSVTKGLSATALADLQAILNGVTADPATILTAENKIDHLNDPQTFNVTVDSPSVTEGNSGTKLLTFTISLLDQNGAATVGSTTINYATTTTGATASSGDDYVAAAGTVTFAPGQTTATVSVTVLGDTVFEANETVKLVLSGSTVFATVTGTGTIVNDDPAPQVYTMGIDSPTVVEGNTGTRVLTFTLTLDQAPLVPVSFNYETLEGNGTATGGSDYTPAGGTVTFAVGQTTATISILVSGDVMPEADETVALRVFGPQLVGATHDAFAIGTILNDDTTFYLTPDQDILTTSEFADTINGTQNTFTLADSIDGLGGIDTLNLIFDGAPSLDPPVFIAPFVSVKNVEKILITSDLSVGSTAIGGSAFDMSGWIGVQTINIRTSGGADVNALSNASTSVTVAAGDMVKYTDNTVATMTVSAGGSADLTANGANTITVGHAVGTTVHAVHANITVADAGVGAVSIFNTDGNIDVVNAAAVSVAVHNATHINTAGTGAATITAFDVGTQTIVGGTATVTEHNVSGVSSITATTGSASLVANALTGAATVTAKVDAHVTVQTATSVTENSGPSFIGDDTTSMTATGVVAWHTGAYGFGTAAHLNLLSSGDHAFADAAKIATLSITDAQDVHVTAGVLDSVTLTGVDTFFFSDSVNITQYSDTGLDLTLVNSNIDSLTLKGATTVNLTATGSDYAYMEGGAGASTVSTLNLTGTGDITLNTREMGGTLTTVNGGGAAHTGNTYLYAVGPINVTTGTGNDYIDVNPGATLNDTVTVNAGAGDNYVDVDSDGIVVVTAGAGNDTVRVNFDALSVAGTSVGLGAGDNTLALRSNDDDITGAELTAFHLGTGAGTVPVTGSLRRLEFDARVVLAASGTATLDASGLAGSVDYISFGDVDLSAPGSTNFTIRGTGPSLTVHSSDDFGTIGSEVINLTTVGLTSLTLNVSDEVAVNYNGVSVQSLTINNQYGRDLYLNLDGDANQDNVLDTLQNLTSVSLMTGEDIVLNVTDLRDNTSLTLHSGMSGGPLGSSTVMIDNSTLGNVTIDFGKNGAHAELDINKTVSGTVSVGNIVINDNEDLGGLPFSDTDSGSSIMIQFSDNTNSTVTALATTANADGRVEMDIHNNDHAVVNLGAISLTSDWESALLLISDNTDLSAGPDAIVHIGNVTITASDAAQMSIVANSDSSMTIGAVVLTSTANHQFHSGSSDAAGFYMAHNSEAGITVTSVTASSGYGAAYVTISDNDASIIQITGDVTATAVNSTASFRIDYNDHAPKITVGNVALNTTGTGANSFMIDHNNSDAEIGTGNVTMTSATGNQTFSLTNNLNVANLHVGNVVMTTGFPGSSTVSMLAGMNSDSTITVGDFNIHSGKTAMFNVSGTSNGGGSTKIGNVDITTQPGGLDDVTVAVGHIAKAGNFTVHAGNDLFFTLDTITTGGSLLDLHSVHNANVTVKAVSTVATINVDAGATGAAVVNIDTATNLQLLDVNAGTTASVTLKTVDAATVFTLDISGVVGAATVNASAADFNSTGLQNIIKIGNGNLNYTGDTVAGAGTNKESREVFKFGESSGTDSVGTDVINNFRPGATAASNNNMPGNLTQVNWTDRLDFHDLTGVTSLDALTFNNNGTDVIIDFVNPAYGSITLTGVGLLLNATDLVIASIVF